MCLWAPSEGSYQPACPHFLLKELTLEDVPAGHLAKAHISLHVRNRFAERS